MKNRKWQRNVGDPIKRNDKQPETHGKMNENRLPFQFQVRVPTVRMDREEMDYLIDPLGINKATQGALGHWIFYEGVAGCLFIPNSADTWGLLAHSF